jgi:ribonuclease E
MSARAPSRGPEEGAEQQGDGTRRRRRRRRRGGRRDDRPEGENAPANWETGSDQDLDPGEGGSEFVGEDAAPFESQDEAGEEKREQPRTGEERGGQRSRRRGRRGGRRGRERRASETSGDVNEQPDIAFSGEHTEFAEESVSPRRARNGTDGPQHEQPVIQIHEKIRYIGAI